MMKESVFKMVDVEFEESVKHEKIVRRNERKSRRLMIHTRLICRSD
jgi:hypothetical protein